MSKIKNRHEKPEAFSLPFSAKYWQFAAGELKSTYMLALAALFIALRIVMGSFFIPVGESNRIFMSFPVNALGAMICGPVISIITGFVADILGYIIAPSGAFFFGYTLTSIAGSFIYALFLYRSRLTIVRIALAKFFVSLIANVGLNVIWSSMLYSKGYWYYLGKSVVKNAIMLPIEIIILYVFFQIMIPVLKRSSLIPDQKSKIIPFI